MIPHSPYRVKKHENLLEMTDDEIDLLPQLKSSELLCTCVQGKRASHLEGKALCTHSKTVECNRHRTVPLRKDDCHERTKRSINSVKNKHKRSAFTYLPDNVIPTTVTPNLQHAHHRSKVISLKKKDSTLV